MQRPMPQSPTMPEDKAATQSRHLRDTVRGDEYLFRILAYAFFRIVVVEVLKETSHQNRSFACEQLESAQDPDQIDLAQQRLRFGEAQSGFELEEIAYYVNKRSVNFIASKLHDNIKAKQMPPCPGKSTIRIPSFRTVYRETEKEIYIAKAIIHELLVTCFIVMRTGRQNARNIKITY